MNDGQLPKQVVNCDNYFYFKIHISGTYLVCEINLVRTGKKIHQFEWHQDSKILIIHYGAKLKVTVLMANGLLLLLLLLQTSHLKSLRFSTCDIMCNCSFHSTVKFFQHRWQRKGCCDVLPARVTRRRTELRRPCDSVTWATNADVVVRVDWQLGHVSDSAAAAVATGPLSVMSSVAVSASNTASTILFLLANISQSEK